MACLTMLSGKCCLTLPHFERGEGGSHRPDMENERLIHDRMVRGGSYGITRHSGRGVCSQAGRCGRCYKSRMDRSRPKPDLVPPASLISCAVGPGFELDVVQHHQVSLDREVCVVVKLPQPENRLPKLMVRVSMIEKMRGGSAEKHRRSSAREQSSLRGTASRYSKVWQLSSLDRACPGVNGTAKETCLLSSVVESINPEWFVGESMAVPHFGIC